MKSAMENYVSCESAGIKNVPSWLTRSLPAPSSFCGYQKIDTAAFFG